MEYTAPVHHTRRDLVRNFLTNLGTLIAISVLARVGWFAVSKAFRLFILSRSHASLPFSPPSPSSLSLLPTPDAATQESLLIPHRTNVLSLSGGMPVLPPIPSALISQKAEPTNFYSRLLASPNCPLEIRLLHFFFIADLPGAPVAFTKFTRLSWLFLIPGFLYKAFVWDLLPEQQNQKRQYATEEQVDFWLKWMRRLRRIVSWFFRGVVNAGIKLDADDEGGVVEPGDDYDSIRRKPITPETMQQYLDKQLATAKAQYEQEDAVLLKEELEKEERRKKRRASKGWKEGDEEDDDDDDENETDDPYG